MTASTQSQTQSFSLKSFGIGLGIAALIYVALFTIAYSKKEATREEMQNRLASMTVLIDRKNQLTFKIRPQNDQPQTETKPESGNVEETPSPESQSEQTEDLENLNLEDIVSQQSRALREAPVEGFYEESASGLLPISKSPTQTPFEIYRKPYVLNKTKPYLAIAINDFGLDENMSQEMIDSLPSTVTLIMSPYSSNPDKWMKAASAAGHEVWLNLPLENKDFPLTDPGAKGLLTRVSLQYNQDRVEWILGRTTGYVGIAAFSDRALENAKNVFEKMGREMLGRGLGYFEMNTGGDSFFLPVAKGSQAPYLQNDVSIDILNVQSPVFQSLQQQIEADGNAAVVITPTPLNLLEILGWMQTLEDSGIATVPLSAAAAPNTERN